MNGDFLWELLAEDVGYGDITTSLLPEMDTRARMIAKQDLVLAGIEEIREFIIANGLDIELRYNDGEEIKKGSTILELHGNVKTMLTLERTILNIIQRMSGIATTTRRCVEMAAGVRVAATRKTILPYLDKKAVIAGGGDPHRWRLDDMFLIKDNHIKVLGIGEAVRKARALSFTKKVEVEAESLEQAIEAAEAGADIVMLDNMSPGQIRDVIDAIKEMELERPLFEASGNITPENLKEYASSGVDIVSMGWLTHSVKAADISLEIIG